MGQYLEWPVYAGTLKEDEVAGIKHIYAMTRETRRSRPFTNNVIQKYVRDRNL